MRNFCSQEINSAELFEKFKSVRNVPCLIIVQFAFQESLVNEMKSLCT
jgi:hypothetical protein